MNGIITAQSKTNGKLRPIIISISDLLLSPTLFFLSFSLSLFFPVCVSPSLILTFDSICPCSHTYKFCVLIAVLQMKRVGEFFTHSMYPPTPRTSEFQCSSVPKSFDIMYAVFLSFCICVCVCAFFLSCQHFSLFSRNSVFALRHFIFHRHRSCLLTKYWSMDVRENELYAMM